MLMLGYFLLAFSSSCLLLGPSRDRGTPLHLHGDGAMGLGAVFFFVTAISYY